MALRQPFMKTPSLSPIPSMVSATSLLSRHLSGEPLLDSSPTTSKFYSDMEDLEYSLSSIDLESLILFPDSDIDLELHLPTDKPIPKRISAFLEHLPARRQPKQRKQHRVSLKLNSMLNQVQKKLGYSKSPTIMCGTKAAGFDSDSDSDSEFGMSEGFAELASSPPSAHIKSDYTLPFQSIPARGSSTYNLATAEKNHKRQAIYGSHVLSDDSPFSMTTPASQQTTRQHNPYPYRASLCSPALGGGYYQMTPDSSPTIDYQKRRKSAFAVLG